MDPQIFIAQSDREISDCFPAFKVLRRATTPIVYIFGRVADFTAIMWR